MTRVRWLRALGGGALALALGFGLTACPEDAADIVKPVATSLDFAVAPVGSGFPTGELTVERVRVAAVDTTLVDAFDRSIDGNRSFYSPGASQFGGGFNLQGFVRNGSSDPRLPALTDADAVVTPSGGDDTGLVILDPSGLCASPCPFHNIFTDGRIDNLDPNTRYVVALVRYAIEVRGALDAAQSITGATVTEPDSLVLLGGTPKGDPTVQIETFPTVVPFQMDANPLVLGFFETDGSGVGAFDVVIDGTGVLYTDNSGNPPDAAFDSSLVARNDDTPTTFPRYNYLVVFQGSPTTAAEVPGLPQVLRVQIGQDFLPAGGMGNNAYAPYPTPLTAQELLALPCCAGRPDSLTLVFQNLEALGSGQWKVWLSNRDRSPVPMIPAVGTYEKVLIVQETDPITGEIISERDSVIETVPNTATFAGEAGLIKHRFTLSDAGKAAGDSIGFFTDVFLTLESDPAAATPSPARVMWFQYTDQNGTPDDFFDDVSQSGTILFGTFDPENPANSRVFTPADIAGSFGFGGVRDNEVAVEIRELPRPPVGMYYEGWLMGPDGNAVSMGPITSLPPDTVSLFDADIDESLPGVTPTGIRFAQARVVLGSVSDIVAKEGDQFVVKLENFFLTLEPKIGAATPAPTLVEAGTLPTGAIIRRLRGQ